MLAPIACSRKQTQDNFVNASIYRNVHAFAFRSHALEIAFVCGRVLSAFRVSAAEALESTSSSGCKSSAVISFVPESVLSPLSEKEYKIVQTVHRR